MKEKILEGLMELVVLEIEIEEQIEFNIEELEKLSELMETERYRDSEAVQEVYNRIFEETVKLLEELRTIEEIKVMLGICK